jgi:DNA-binding response OmpR family regulator
MDRSCKILLVEDDPNLGFVTQESLELQGFAVTLVKDGEKAYDAFLKESFDLCLIDVMLPVKDGFALAGEIRRINRQIPMIFLTAKSLKEDKIEGFRLGCDDYITKPFSMEELVLRIQAVMRRARPEAACGKEDEFGIGEYRFDHTHRILKHAAEEYKLTHKESELLRLLCLHQNAVLEREVALKLVWGDDSFFNARSMDVYITKLRKYLSADPRIEIVNIHGRGFKLTVT